MAEEYTVIPHPKLKRDYKGGTIRTKHDVQNGWGVIPAGTIATISHQSPKGSTIRVPRCECCGLQAHVSRVDAETFEFVELASE